MVKPETGQANFSENRIRSGPLLSWIFATFFAADSACSLPPCGGGLGRGVASDAVARGLPPSRRFVTSPTRGEVTEEDDGGASAYSITASPSASFSAVSKLSARR